MRDFQGYNLVAHCNYNLLGKSKESCDKLDLCQRLTFAFTSVSVFPSHSFKMSKITLETFLFHHSFGGDTVCMTLFIVPIFTSVAILALSSHPPLGSSVCQPSKHSLSLIFPIKKAGGIPSRLSPISQPVPLSRCPSVHVPFWPFKWQETMKRRESLRCLVVLTDRVTWHILISRERDIGADRMRAILYNNNQKKTSAWSHKWEFKIQD